MGEGFAAAITAGFWIGMTAGRLGLAAIGNRIDPERLLWEASLLSVAAAALLWADPFGVGLFAIPIIGLAFSVMFPLAMGRTPHYLGSERTSRVVGYQFAGSAIGAVTLPALIGVLADTHGIKIAPPAILATMVGMTLLWGTIRREARVSPAVP